MVGPFQLSGIGGKILGKVDETVKRTHEGVKEQVTKVDQKVKEKLSEADQKIKKEILKKFLEQFSNIKKLNLPIEETLPRLQKALEEFESMILRSLPNEVESKEETLKNGSEGIAGFGKSWERLHENSKKFLKTGECLYSYLCESLESSNDEIDYSPVTLEYCKAFENELGMNFFEKYRSTLIQYSKIDHNAIENINKLNLDDNKKKFKLNTYEMLKSYIENDNYHPPAIMGMGNILGSLRGELAKSSILFEHLKNKLLDDWNESILFGNENITTIDNKCREIRDFRNGSAHVSVQSKVKAEQCRSLVLGYLPFMMENYKDKI